ncbi:MAG TPA: hypothetical protein VM781_02030, partial [Candidatus Bathyarchaeia archaeon]|nr:hypothetical protein [Candidatus Bathyarchaeia archaeon]
MRAAQPPENANLLPVTKNLKTNRVWQLVAISLAFSPMVLCPAASAQTATPGPPTPPACPVQFVHFNPSGVNVRVKNVSGKNIVGLVFNAALA